MNELLNLQESLTWITKDSDMIESLEGQRNALNISIGARQLAIILERILNEKKLFTVENPRNIIISVLHTDYSSNNESISISLFQYDDGDNSTEIIDEDFYDLPTEISSFLEYNFIPKEERDLDEGCEVVYELDIEALVSRISEVVEKE